MREILAAATFRKCLQVHNETDIEDVKIEDRPFCFFEHLCTEFSFLHFFPEAFWAFGFLTIT